MRRPLFWCAAACFTLVASLCGQQTDQETIKQLTERLAESAGLLPPGGMAWRPRDAAGDPARHAKARAVARIRATAAHRLRELPAACRAIARATARDTGCIGCAHRITSVRAPRRAAWTAVA